MAFGIYIWKWKAAPYDSVEVIVNDLAQDVPHASLSRFDMNGLVRTIEKRFGDVNDDPDGPFLYDVYDFTDASANWMTMSINWSKVDKVLGQIIEIANGQGLVVFDPQSGKTFSP